MTHPIDTLEALDPLPEDLLWADEVEPVTCERCGRPLEDEELLQGALCSDHMPRLPLLAWVPPRIRRGYRGRG